MKKMFAAMTAALMMVALVSSVALAAPSKGAGTPFTARYDDGFGQTFTCTGTHVVNKNVVKDNETCLATGAGFVAGTYTGSPYGALPPYPFPGYRTTSWQSDFPGTFYGTQATSWTITETDNGDGTFTWGIAAIYQASQPTASPQHLAFHVGGYDPNNEPTTGSLYTKIDTSGSTSPHVNNNR